MLNRKSIERALAVPPVTRTKASSRVSRSLRPRCSRRADLRAQLAAEAPEWTDEEIEAARLGKETLLLAPSRHD